MRKNILTIFTIFIWIFQNDDTQSPIILLEYKLHIWASSSLAVCCQYSIVFLFIFCTSYLACMCAVNQQAGSTWTNAWKGKWSCAIKRCKKKNIYMYIYKSTIMMVKRYMRIVLDSGTRQHLPHAFLFFFSFQISLSRTVCSSSSDPPASCIIIGLLCTLPTTYRYYRA